MGRNSPSKVYTYGLFTVISDNDNNRAEKTSKAAALTAVGQIIITIEGNLKERYNISMLK